MDFFRQRYCQVAPLLAAWWVCSWAILASAASYDLPVQAANYSGFDPFFTNAPALKLNQRVLRFDLPQDFVVNTNWVNEPGVSGWNSRYMNWPTNRDSSKWFPKPVPDRPNNREFGSVVVSTAVHTYVGGSFEETLEETIASDFGSTGLGVPMTAPLSDVQVKYVVQGGSANGKELTLKGKLAYGVRAFQPRDDSTIAYGQMEIGLEWGEGPLGWGPWILLIRFEVDATVFFSDPILPLSEVSSSLLMQSTPLAYVQKILDEYRSQVVPQKLQLLGAVPELLVLYDFSGTNTVSPLLTVPESALLSFSPSFSYKEVYRYINQYDAGASEGLPVRFRAAGGNACGPTALRLLLNTLGLDHTATNVYQSTMEKGMAVRPEESNTFLWVRARDWLEGKTNTRPRTGLPAGLPAGAQAYKFEERGAAAISNKWAWIDQRLTSSNQHPVLLGTDLTARFSGRSGGHVILLLGRGHSEYVRQAYNLSGDYYVVADPAGHYFANTNGTHYDRVTNLMAQCVGINYGGWCAIYPLEWLRDRIRDTNGVPLMRGLTIDVPFPVLRVDARSPVSIVVTDPLGRRTGWQSDSRILEEIPDSWFSFETGDEEEGETIVFTNGVKTVLVNNPLAGNYQVQLTGTGKGSFTLDWSGFDPGRPPTLQSISDTIALNQQRTYQFTFGAAAPRLAISKVGLQTRISWPASAAGFVLQSTADLSLPNGWVTVLNPPSSNGSQLIVTNTSVRAAEWFRLRKP